MKREITPNERRARVICKLLWQDRTLRLETLRSLSGQEQSRASGVRHSRLGRTGGDFDQAVAIGIEMGWLIQGPEGLELTAAGVDIARRTRAGVRRSRLNDVGRDAT